MSLEIIFIIIPVITVIILFLIKTNKKHFLIKIILYVFRFITIIVLIFLVLLFFYPKILSQINTYFIKKYDMIIPTVSFSELEEVVKMISNQEDIGYIGKIWDWYTAYSKKDMKSISISDSDEVFKKLVNNNILYVSINKDWYYYFWISKSVWIFSFSASWNLDSKNWKLEWSGKSNKKLNDNWMVFEGCNRNTCPELDK